MSSYFALWRAILHVPFSPLPFQNIVYLCLTCNALYTIATPYTRCHPCNALYVIASALPIMGTPRDTVYSRGKGINKQKTSIFAFCVKWLVTSAVYDVFRATHSMSLWHHILVVLRATHSMSLRAQRGNLPEGLPCYALCHCIYTKIATPKNYLNIHFKTQRFFAHLIYFHSNNIA